MERVALQEMGKVKRERENKVKGASLLESGGSKDVVITKKFIYFLYVQRKYIFGSFSQNDLLMWWAFRLITSWQVVLSRNSMLFELNELNPFEPDPPDAFVAVRNNSIGSIDWHRNNGDLKRRNFFLSFRRILSTASSSNLFSFCLKLVDLPGWMFDKCCILQDRLATSILPIENGEVFFLANV